MSFVPAGFRFARPILGSLAVASLCIAAGFGCSESTTGPSAPPGTTEKKVIDTSKGETGPGAAIKVQTPAGKGPRM